MRACVVCTHPERAEIDRALVSSVPLRDIEARHSGTTRPGLDRHRKHIPAALTRAKQAEKVAEATGLLSRLEKLLSHCEESFAQAKRARSWTGAASFAREIRGCLELLGKLSGELKTGTQVAITMANIQTLDISALSPAQVRALFDRVQAERLREVREMSDAELDAELSKFVEENGFARAV